MNGFPETQDKSEWRRWAKARRRELDIPHAFDTIEPTLLNLGEWKSANRVLLYFATSTEININSVLREVSGKEWYLPRCTEGNHLSVHRVFSDSTDELQQNHFGIYEPHPDSPEVGVEALDLVVVPALAFDEHGNRLGYGGGFYDRFLPRLCPDCVTVGVTLDDLVVSDLPSEPHDIPVQIIVTESRVIRRVDTTKPIPHPYSD